MSYCSLISLVKQQGFWPLLSGEFEPDSYIYVHIWGVNTMACEILLSHQANSKRGVLKGFWYERDYIEST